MTRVCIEPGCGRPTTESRRCARCYKRHLRANGRGNRVPVTPCTMARQHSWGGEPRCQLCGLEKVKDLWT